VIDCFSRRVVGWAIADHMRTDLIIDASGWRSSREIHRRLAVRVPHRHPCDAVYGMAAANTLFCRG